MATEDFYTFSEKLLRHNPEIWYGVAAVVGWLLLVRLYRLCRANEDERRAMLKSCAGMAFFLILFALAAVGFATAFTLLAAR